MNHDQFFLWASPIIVQCIKNNIPYNFSISSNNHFSRLEVNGGVTSDDREGRTVYNDWAQENFISLEEQVDELVRKNLTYKYKEGGK